MSATSCNSLCWDPVLALVHRDKSSFLSTPVVPHQLRGERATETFRGGARTGWGGKEQGREQDGGMTSHMDTRHKLQLTGSCCYSLPERAGRTITQPRPWGLGSFLSHTAAPKHGDGGCRVYTCQQAAARGLEPSWAPRMWQGCPSPRAGPPSSCRASPTVLGSSGSIKREKRSLRYLGWELE